MPVCKFKHNVLIKYNQLQLVSQSKNIENTINNNMITICSSPSNDTTFFVKANKKSSNRNGVNIKIKQFRLKPIEIIENGITYEIQVETEDNMIQGANTQNLNEELSSEVVDIKLENNDYCQSTSDECWSKPMFSISFYLIL